MIVIVGAGIAGLACAHILNETGREVRVFEAATQPGGRVRSLVIDGRVVGELGPSWLWPRWQPVAADWLRRLGIDTFAQHDTGDALLDLRLDGSPRRTSLPGQDGIRRVCGGPGAIVDALCARLPDGVVLTDSAVDAVTAGENAMQVSVANQAPIHVDGVVMACPPRIALERIAFDPPLSEPLRSALASAPTWMARQAKAVAVFETPFWRESGLSGRVASQAGPLVEIHDHCGPEGHPAALFGFVGVPSIARRCQDVALGNAIRQQLERCFGPAAASPLRLHIEDWSMNSNVCSRLDQEGQEVHPSVLPEIVRGGACDGRLWFSSAETSALSPGLLEGALAAGETTARAVLQGAA